MPSPYKFQFDETTQSYVFTTDNGIIYKIVFIVDYSFSAIANIEIKDIYQVILERTTESKEPLDPNVPATICEILLIFFKTTTNIALWICDDGDERAEVRFRKFNKWYGESGLASTITKLDSVIISENVAGSAKIFSSLLYHNENNNKEIILNIYHSIQQILNEKP